MEAHLSSTVSFRMERIDGDGQFLDGGDVLKVPGGNKVYVGLSSRSSLEGIERLQEILPNHDVQGVPTTKVLHLKSCITALPDGTIIGYDPIVDDVNFFGDVSDRQRPSRSDSKSNTPPTHIPPTHISPTHLVNNPLLVASLLAPPTPPPELPRTSRRGRCARSRFGPSNPSHGIVRP